MNETRKERITAASNKKTIEQFDQTHLVYKRGTAVLSTTLLVGLLAFPSFSVSATANDLANSSTAKLENTKEITESIVNEDGENATKEQVVQVLSEDSMIEKEQKIKELKLLLSEVQIAELKFDELTIDEIEDLLLEALDASNQTSIISEDSLSVEDSVEKDENNNAVDVINENEVIAEKLAADEATEQATSEKQATDEAAVKAAAEEVESDKAATAKATAKKEAADKAATAKVAAEKEAAEKAATAKSAAEKEAAEKAETAKAVAEKQETNEAAVKAAAEEVEAEKAAIAKATAEKEAADKAAIAKATAEKEAAEKAATAKVAAEKEATEKAATAKVAADKAATAKAAAAKADLAKIYIVKSGDTLNKISKAHGITVAELKSWNKLSSNLIHPGDALAVNKSGSAVIKTSNEAINSNKGIEKMSNSEFINFIGAYAAEVAPKNDLYASVMVAQAALESGFGSSKLSSSPNHNLFGIKGSYQGQTVTMYTSEYSDKGGWIYIPQNFKKYPSHAESLQDNANLLKNGTNWNNGFYSGAWVSNTNSFSDATAWLQGRYATDPSYASKLNRLISDYDLTRFDKGYTGGNSSTKPTPTPSPIPGGNTNGSNGTDVGTTVTSNYQVKSGDTLWGIATSKNVSVANLKAWNNLKSDVIYVGQNLVIKGPVTIPAPKPEVNKPEVSKPDSTQTDSNSTVTSNYQVKSGDTLWDIATSKNVSVANLKTWNNLKSDVIYVGQSLVIKGTVTTPSPKPEINKPGSTQTDSTATSSYQVKSGDSLWGIATSKHVSVANLKLWNNLKSDVIYVGQTLVFKESVSTPTPKPEVNNPSTTVTSGYQVKNGDSLWSIATTNNVSVANLKSWNNLKSDVIYIGQKLTIKTNTPAPTLKPTPGNAGLGSSTPSTATSNYQVKNGDSLWSIATANHVSVANLKSWNNLKSDVIYIDQKLTIKGSTPTVSGNTTTETTVTTNPTIASDYQVKSGDTLWGIANTHNLSIVSLKALNNLKSDTITVGQRLIIQSIPQNTPVKENIKKTYKVSSGDSLWAIAAKLNTSVVKLKELNHLKTDIIFVGQSLIVK